MSVINTFNDMWIYFLGCPDCWAGVIGVILLVIIWIAYRRMQRTIIVYKSELGKVRVSISALVHLIKEACGRAGVLQCNKVKFHENKGKFDVDLTVRVGIEQNMADLLENLNHVIHIILGRILGPDYIGKISLNVVGFKGDVKDIPIVPVSDLEPKPEEFKLLAKKDTPEVEKV